MEYDQELLESAQTCNELYLAGKIETLSLLEEHFENALQKFWNKESIVTLLRSVRLNLMEE